MIIEANGVSFHCEVSGEESNPCVVMSNSLMTTLEMWDEQAEALRDYRVVRYDQRGHGETTGADRSFTFDDLVNDLIAILDALDVSRATFLGLSMGGTTAFGAALRYPERVERLIACDTSATSTPAAAKQWAERIALVEEQGMKALVDPTINRWFPAEVVESNPAHVDDVRKMIEATPLEGFIRGAEALSNVDFASNVTEIKSPTLFVVGSEDGVAPSMRQLHGALEGSQLVELAGAGHLSNLDAPDAFNAAVSTFLTAEE